MDISKQKVTSFINRIPTKDLILAILIFLIAGGTAFYRASLLDTVIYSRDNKNRVLTADIYFDGDISKIYRLMTNRSGSEHLITSEHPFISLITYPPIYFLTKVFKISQVNAVYLFVACMAAIWALAFFGLLRIINLQPVDAALITFLGMNSASYVFWFSVPEVFPIGSISIICSLGIVLLAETSKSPFVLYCLANFISFGVTTTNIMVSAIPIILRKKIIQGSKIIISSLIIASAFFGIEKTIFPQAQFFAFGSNRLSKFILIPSFDRVINVLRGFFLNTIVMPEIGIIEFSDYWISMKFSVQETLISGTNIIGIISLLLWIILFSISIFSCCKQFRNSLLKQSVVMIIFCQLFLHFFFGSETFLYSMHFLPLLLLLIAFSTQTRFRKISLFMIIALIAFTMINNYGQFTNMVNQLHYIGNLASLSY